MAKLTNKTALTEFADSDLIHVVDVSDTTSSAEGTSKKSTWSLIKTTLASFFGTIATQDADSVVITGGAIDGTTLGATTPSSGSFTTLRMSQNEETLSATKNLTSSSPQIQLLDPNAGDYDVIAESSPVNGRPYILRNTGSSGNLIFKNNAETQVFEGLPTGFTGMFVYDGTTSLWVRILKTNDNITAAQLEAIALIDQAEGLATTSNVTFASATLSNLTASELMASDGSKKAVSLSVATYPSLTEIAYVKGVTSAIQTQIDAKQTILSEGAFVDGDKTKLDGIETAADVTDTTNVTAAGALMDSELTNIADVKALEVGTTVQAYDLVLEEIASPLITVDATTQRTLALTDANDYIRFTSASDVTVTVPLNSAVAFPTKTRIDFARIGTGNVTVTATGGVTINKAEGLKIAAQYKGATLIKVDTDEWDLIGALAA